MAIWLPISASLVVAPFLGDIVLRERCSQGFHWLLFPFSMVLVEIALSNTDYISAYVSPTNMLAEFSLLSPIARVGGFFAISLFINGLISFTWTFWLLRSNSNVRVLSPAALVFFSFIVVIYMVGKQMYQISSPSSTRINVAMVAGDQNELFSSWKSFVLRNRATGSRLKDLSDIYNQQLARGLARTEALMGEGLLDLVIWPEESVFVPHDSIEDFQRRLAQFAKGHRIDLMIGYALDTGRLEAPFMENRAAYFDKTGEKLFDYVKTKLVPGAESHFFVRGKQELPFTHTSFGSVAGGICRDFGYPFLVRKAALRKPSLFLAPTAWFHPTGLDRMGNIMRAMETGIPFVIANQSSGLVVDGQGRVLAEKHYAIGESGLRYEGLAIQ